MNTKSIEKLYASLSTQDYSTLLDTCIELGIKVIVKKFPAYPLHFEVKGKLVKHNPIYDYENNTPFYQVTSLSGDCQFKVANIKEAILFNGKTPKAKPILLLWLIEEK